jgi:hypothetical protein
MFLFYFCCCSVKQAMCTRILEGFPYVFVLFLLLLREASNVYKNTGGIPLCFCFIFVVAPWSKQCVHEYWSDSLMFLFYFCCCSVKQAMCTRILEGFPCVFVLFSTCQARDHLDCPLEKLRDPSQWRRLIKMTVTCSLSVRVWFWSCTRNLLQVVVRFKDGLRIFTHLAKILIYFYHS